MAATNKNIIDEAKKRGITITAAAEGHQGSFIHNGQEYILEGRDGVQALADDMYALEEIITQDDLYSVEWNEDVNRYIVSVNGEEDDFSDEKLRQAFRKAKDKVMAGKQPDPSPLPEPPKPAPQALQAPKGAAAQVTSGKRTQKPTPAPQAPKAAAQPAQPKGNGSLPPTVIEAVEDLIGSVADLLYAIKNAGELGRSEPGKQPEANEPDLEPFEEPEIEDLPNPLPPPRRGMQTRAAK